MRSWFSLVGILFLVSTLNVVAEDKKPVYELWPGKAPGENGLIGEEKFQEPRKNEKADVKRLTNITKPTITIYKPVKEKDTGAAVVIAPGGGYNILAWDLEGEEVAQWFNSIGVTGILLKYRVPRRPESPKDAPPIQALMDAQRAIRMVRGKATDWGIDPKRIGMLGFSAGGHLTAWTSTNFDQPSYEAIDDLDKQSPRPDFGILIYPGYLVRGAKEELAPEIRINKETPPMFFAHAGNDPVKPENSVLAYLALKKLNIPAELHIYSTGGHGFGLRKTDNPCCTWPERCGEWMNKQGYLKAK